MTPVLYYHRVGPFHPGAPRKMTVTPENFRRQVRYLERRGYTLVRLDQVPTKGKSAAITFDDGYLDVFEHAVPLLHAPAALFVVAGRVGMTDTWYRGEDRLADWSHLRELIKLGWTLGSHSMTHASLDEIPEAEARCEIFDSKKLLEDRLGIAVRHFAYPRGQYSPRVVALVQEAGYTSAWATKSGDDTPFARRRFPIAASAGIIRFAARILKIRLSYY